ncbi:hypothetical protein SORBI_3003G363600 [Sorghum bicolor]|uniref:BZIP domain-containing protein n=1 Tax=Sorghum bicolor TaxID=4558 RepID=A0A1W0W0H8_SORBI|nr:hypothetical protein SORBI_3003G363600 [Sorghum bicolor]
MVHGEESSWRMERAALPLNQAFAYGAQAHAAAAPPTCFLDFQPAAAAAAYFGFGELEEALIHGGGGAGNAHGVDPGVIIKNDVAQAKSAAAAGYLAGAGRPPTLEIFPSWPMRHQQQLHSGNSQSVGSTTDSSSAQNTMSQMELVSPASSAPRQEVMMVTTDDYSYKPGLAAAPAAAAAPPPSFQQHHPLPLQLHGGDGGGGGGDHDKRKHGSTRKDGKLVDAKTERRLAQNREAARKSRLRKKAYVQQLETSRIRLQQVEHELQRARSQAPPCSTWSTRGGWTTTASGWRSSELGCRRSCWTATWGSSWRSACSTTTSCSSSRRRSRAPMSSTSSPAPGPPPPSAASSGWAASARLSCSRS